MGVAATAQVGRPPLEGGAEGVSVILSRDLVRRVKRFQRRNRIGSFSAAARELAFCGLEQPGPIEPYSGDPLPKRQQVKRSLMLTEPLVGIIDALDQRHWGRSAVLRWALERALEGWEREGK